MPAAKVKKPARMGNGVIVLRLKSRLRFATARTMIVTARWMKTSPGPVPLLAEVAQRPAGMDNGLIALLLNLKLRFAMAWTITATARLMKI